MLKFNVRNQTISRVDSFRPAAKSVHYLLAQFNFLTADWSGTIKTAVFQNPTTGKMYDALLDEDVCVVPWEAIDNSGECGVSVYGVGDYRITTNIAEFKINPTLFGGTGTQAPTPSVYEQLLDNITHISGGTFADWKE